MTTDRMTCLPCALGFYSACHGDPCTSGEAVGVGALVLTAPCSTCHAHPGELCAADHPHAGRGAATAAPSDAA